MNIYFISGLGADKRAFEKISLDSKFISHYIDWLEPLKNERIEQYAERMSETIEKHQPFVIVGLSFGGIIAGEISKLYHAEKVILISSISNKNELPWYYKAVGKLNLHNTKLIELLKQRSQLLYWFFGTRSHKLKEYLDEMIHKTSVDYLQWSLTQILNWKQEQKLVNVIHIHGSADKLFPIRYCKPDCIIPNAGHFMVVTHGKELSRRIEEECRLISI